MSATILAEGTLMLGVLLGLVLLVAIPLMARDAQIEDFGTAIYFLPLVVLIGGYLIGMLFSKTVGMGSLGAILGGLIGVVLALVNGHVSLAPAFLLTSVAGWALSQIMAADQQAYRAWRASR